MNVAGNHHESEWDDLAAIDRLVDGELDQRGRRELLLAFDERPDGWRRCALAFLEAQAWREGSRRFADVRPPAPVTVADPPRPRGSQSVNWLLIAASMLVATGLTLVVSEHFRAPVASVPVATNREAQPAQTNKGAIAASPNRDSLTLLVDQGADGPSVPLRVPLVEAEAAGPLSNSQDNPVPPQVRRWLESMGHRVEAHRRYAPLDLESGGRVLVPVDDVRIIPATRDLQ